MDESTTPLVFTERRPLQDYLDGLPDDSRFKLFCGKRECLTKAANDGAEYIRKIFIIDETVKQAEINDDETIVHIISTEAVDRHGDVVKAAGIKRDNFGGVVFYNHNQNIPLGRSYWVKRDPTNKSRTIAKTKLQGGTPDTDRIVSLFTKPFIKGQPMLTGWSIGFIGRKGHAATDADRKAYGEQCRYVFDEIELLEYSAVTIPANPEAVTTTIGDGKSFGAISDETISIIQKSIKPSSLVDTSEVQNHTAEDADSEEKSVGASDDEDDADEEGTFETKALTHDNATADSEPSWGAVDKTKLPEKAFVWQAPGHDKDERETWKYLHHFVVDGDVGEDGVYTAGIMKLHKGGLNAAWSAAMGGRSGQKAPQAVIEHLQAHRKALGMDDEGKSIELDEVVDGMRFDEELTGTVGDVVKRLNRAGVLVTMHGKALSPEGTPSVGDILEGVQAALRNMLPVESGIHKFEIEDVYPDTATAGRCVVELSYTNKPCAYFMYGYTIQETGEVTLGEPLRMVETYKPKGFGAVKRKEVNPDTIRINMDEREQEPDAMRLDVDALTEIVKETIGDLSGRITGLKQELSGMIDEKIKKARGKVM